MAATDDKENLAPLTSSDPLQQKNSNSSPRKVSRKGRSKSIGPGGLDEAEGPKPDFKDAKNRRKSTYVPTTKAIISADAEKAERQAARRRTLANRRVSFAPEATLHTWDVIEFMRDPTTSTDSSESTRRASNITRSSNGGSPFKRSNALDSDPPSTPPEQADEPASSPSSPAHQRDLHQKKRRRSSGISPSDTSSPSGASGSSDVSESEDGDEDAEGSEDETGTAMSLDLDDNTVQSMAASDSSTGSSARLEAALKQAASAAGTRGIEYDEYGDASMELAGDEVTNAFKPWAEQKAATQPSGSASLDQENVNPFSPAFKAQLVSGYVSRPATVVEEDTGDLSMDMTRAVGGIMKAPVEKATSSPDGDGTMDLTLAVGKIHSHDKDQSPVTQSGQKRPRSTTEDGSPGVAGPVSQTKRRRSSVARSSMGDDTMDLTIAVGGIQNTRSPAKPDRRKSVAQRRSSGAVSEADEGTMDFTQAIGGIKAAARADHTSSSFDENEELTMELTTVLGDIKEANNATNDARPVTPQQSQSPIKDAANTTPKDQERFKDAPDSGPKKLLTPIFQKQVMRSAEKKGSSIKTRTRSNLAFVETVGDAETAEDELPASVGKTSKTSTPKAETPKVNAPSLRDHRSPLKTTPNKSSSRTQSKATPEDELQNQIDAQLQSQDQSPVLQKQLRSTPAKAPATPDKTDEPTQDGRRLADSIKLMSTPRKETLKSVTPKHPTPAKQTSPQKSMTPRPRPTPKTSSNLNASPARQLKEDLSKLQTSSIPTEKIHLQKFLDQAGIRFMDLTTTKRRMTTVPTPSKNRNADSVQDSDSAEVSLETAILAGACTIPELEMYEHACHELRRYISDGKNVIKELEVETSQSTPALIQAYLAAAPARRAVLDSQMREIKTHARYRSKEMWYAWRSQLLEDLMKGMQGIGEGLIKDDEILSHAESILNQVLPGLVQQHENLTAEAEGLEREAQATSEEEKAELEEARERLVVADDEIGEKQKLLEDLQTQMQEAETQVADLQESKDEFVGAIKEADRVKEACRSVSNVELAGLKGTYYHPSHL